MKPGLGPALTPNILLQFLNAEGNILVTLSSESAAPSSIVGLLAELDIHLPPERTGLVVDHFNYDSASSSDKHDVLLLAPPSPVRAGIKPLFAPETAGSELIAFPRGVGHVLGGGPLLTPVLRAPRTAYSYNPKEETETVDPDELFAVGEQLSLVSTMQGRNSARFTLVGAAEMLGDKWFGAKIKTMEGQKGATWNQEFAKRISGWTFGETGVVRVNDIEHHMVGTNASNPDIYRIKNEVVRWLTL